MEKIKMFRPGDEEIYLSPIQPLYPETYCRPGYFYRDTDVEPILAENKRLKAQVDRLTKQCRIGNEAREVRRSEENFLNWYREICGPLPPPAEDAAKHDPAAWFYWAVLLFVACAMVAWPWW